MGQTAFLNVEQSLTGRHWVGPSDEVRRLAEAMGQRFDLPLPLSHVLAGRGVGLEEVPSYLAPALRDLLPDPMGLRDMGPAVERFLAAVKTHEKIAVFADYDVDGGSSAALLLVWLRQMGHQATLYIPDRIEEGYGPNEPAMQALAGDHGLIVCVDCGTLSHGPIAAAKGADVLVLDHHLGGETLPAAHAVVNPNRQDEDGALAHLCAAGVVFLMLVEANRRLRLQGVQGPDLMAMLDLVALATVADVAPLIGVNRAFVRQGLKVMARRERVGVRVLADVARMDQAPSVYSLGFVLGPRINAGGRIGQADLGARLLACEDEAEAEKMAKELEAFNHARREIEAEVRLQAMAQAERRGLDAPLVWAAGEGWHPGVVGIAAARLKEATNRPAAVIGLSGGIGKGSARSIAGVDLGAAVQRVAAEGLLIKGGGHKMAAGLTVAQEHLEAAMARLGELLAKQGAGQSRAEDLYLDGLIDPLAATHEFVERLEEAGPYGSAAPPPCFVFADQAVQARRMGERHLRIHFGPRERRLEAVAFGALDGPLGPALEQGGHQRFHLAGRLELNHYGGRTKVQLRLEDAALSK